MAHPVSTGYGLGASSASVPFFEGKREDFADFTCIIKFGSMAVSPVDRTASWGEDPSTRKSQSGYVFTLANAAIQWKSKLQTTVALSSTEAEYLALSAAVKEALFIRGLLDDILPSAASDGIVLHEDNQSTIKQALNLQGSERTKRAGSAEPITC